MPYANIQQAKGAGFPTSAEDIPLTITQINELSEIYDAIKKAGGTDNPMAVAWTTWKKTYKIEAGRWVKIKKTEAMEIYYRGDPINCQEAAKFKKDLIAVGTFLHPQREGERVKITKEGIDNWIENFHRYQANGGKVFIPLRHTENPKDNTGWVKDLIREENKLFGILNITDEEVAKKLTDGSIQDVSISIHPNFKDEKGNIYDEMIDHVALTVIPQIRGQGPFVKLEQGFVSLEEVNMFEDKLLVFYEENEGEEFRELKSAIQLLKEDYNKDKFSNKSWADVDKTKLDKPDFLFTPDPDHRSTWKLPYRDDTGKINIGAVKAIWAVLQGAHGRDVDIPADVLADIKSKVDGWRKELGLEEHVVKEEEMKELEDAKKKIKELEDKKLELEKKLQDNSNLDMEALKKEIENEKKKVEELATFKAEQERKEIEDRVDNLVKTGKVPPALRDRLLALVQSKKEAIQLESKNDKGEIEKKTIIADELLLEILGELPQYVGFEEKTVLETKTELEETETKKIARETAEKITGDSRSAQVERANKK